MAEVIQNTTSQDTSTGGWWSNVGIGLGSTINGLSDLFLQKEMAKVHASIAASNAQANAQVAIAQAQANAAAQTASTATANNASGTGGSGGASGWGVPAWALWAGGGVIALVGLKAFKVI